MVGKRTWANTDHHVNGAQKPKKPIRRHTGNNDDVPRADRPRLFKFTDRALEEHNREEMKNKLLKSADGQDWEKYRMSDEDIKKINNPKVKRFYEEQNQRLNDWLEVDALVIALADDVLESFNPDPDYDGILENAGALQNVGEDMEAFLPENEIMKRQTAGRKAKWAININVLANIFLLAAKIGAVFFSSSLSLIASLVDSALDLLCTIIIWSTNKLVSWRLSSLHARFPVGRRRLEPLGILVFSIIMVISFLQILQESFSKLLPSGHHTVAALAPIAIFAMAATIAVKGAIWIICIRIPTTQVQALAQDCKTDVIFNTLSLLFPAIGHHWDIWWLDPLGAGLLSIFIIIDWSHTCVENVVRLSGSAADERVVQKITFVAYRFSSLVQGFKSIRAYHAGDGVWCEVDILLDANEVLVRAHDVAETLQYCLEGLVEVDRAFVTIDYTSYGPTGHSTALV
ncbi:cation efflux protein [Microthyrium microscopicum]|uniref:Cation efflux protein n=1 Tax=Microthyrium microscopicum TaxID=703497 RepID=A0A6A6UB53_9PEZI|nr:cation efflux protein [Microthyrium microscopicum]